MPSAHTSEKGLLLVVDVSGDKLTFNMKENLIEPMRIIWEGTQFGFHSLALVNREVSLQLRNGGWQFSTIPYEVDHFGQGLMNCSDLWEWYLHRKRKGNALWGKP